MARILAILFLTAVVYSWEEFKLFLRSLVFSVFRRPSNFEIDRQRARRIDSSVATFVILASVPIGLFYLIINAESVWAKVLWIAITLVAVAVAAVVSEVLLRRAQYASPLVVIIAWFSPMIAAVAETGNLPRKILGKFALLLSLPFFFGLLVRYLNQPTRSNLIAGFDFLTLVLIGSLLLRMTVEILEHYFKWYRLEKLFDYYRIVLGIVLGAILILG